MKILFSAHGVATTGSYRIPFIGMRSVIAGMTGVEIVEEDSGTSPDVAVCLAGQGEAVRLRQKFPGCFLVLAKPHYEIVYSFRWLRDFPRALKSLIRAVVPRESNVNFQRVKRDIAVSDVVLADSRKLELSFKSAGVNAIFTRLHERLPKVEYQNRVLPEPGGELNICYHGHSEILSRSEEYFAKVFTELARTFRVRFFCMTDLRFMRHRPTWRYVTTDYIQYDFDQLVSLLPNMHIGLVPIRLSPSKLYSKKLLSLLVFGGFQDNIEIFAEKPSVNAGRAYVFSHFGIPFIADPTPEVLLDFGGINGLEFPQTADEAAHAVRNLTDSHQRYSTISAALLGASKKTLNLEVESSRLLNLLGTLVEQRRGRPTTSAGH